MACSGIQRKNFPFGAALDEFDDVPGIVRQICDFIVETAIETEGILCKDGSIKDILEIRKLFEEQSVVDLKAIGANPHAAAGVLKMFLGELKGGLVNEETALGFVRIAESRDNAEVRVKRYCDLLSRMPMKNRRLLIYLIDFLRKVADKASTNEMTPKVIGSDFSQAILFCGNSFEGMKMPKIAKKLLTELIKYLQELQDFEQRMQQVE